MMTSALAFDLADLLAAATPPVSCGHGSTTALARLEPWRPRLVVFAKPDGRVVAAFGDDTGDTTGTVAPLAARCAERLQDAPSCRFVTGQDRWQETVVAGRLPGVSDGTIVVCVFATDAAGGPLLDEDAGLGALVAPLAARTAADAAERAILTTRIEHLQAEHDTLRAAHSEATANALEEREERLHAQQEHARQLQRDIAERKQAELALQRLHLQNAMILNSAGEGICGIDVNGRAMFVNPAAARMLGYRPEELVGDRLHERIHHSRADGMPNAPEQCPMCRAAKGRLVARVDTEVFWRADGMPFPVEYMATPINEGGEVVGAVVTFRDISEQRMLEAQLRQAQKLESIGQLAAGIAHEINTPTQYIGDNTRFLGDSFAGLGNLLNRYARLLEAAKSGSVTEPLIDEVERAAAEADLDFVIREIPAAIRQSLDGVAQVAKIVRSMKEFSHPGGDEKQAIDLNQAISSTLTVSRNEWKYLADVVTDLDESLPHVTCLPSDFNQVMLNLIVNAAHAIGDRLGPEPDGKGTITVRTRREGPLAEVRVADTGTGISPAIRNRVFDPFFTTKQVGRGTGQGLAIVHSIITERHGGTIHLETELGRGTEFIVRLPIEPKEVRSAKIPVRR